MDAIVELETEPDGISVRLLVGGGGQRGYDVFFRPYYKTYYLGIRAARVMAKRLGVNIVEAFLDGEPMEWLYPTTARSP